MRLATLFGYTRSHRGHFHSHTSFEPFGVYCRFLPGCVRFLTNSGAYFSLLAGNSISPRLASHFMLAFAKASVCCFSVTVTGFMSSWFCNHETMLFDHATGDRLLVHPVSGPTIMESSMVSSLVSLTRTTCL